MFYSLAPQTSKVAITSKGVTIAIYLGMHPSSNYKEPVVDLLHYNISHKTQFFRFWDGLESPPFKTVFSSDGT